MRNTLLANSKVAVGSDVPHVLIKDNRSGGVTTSLPAGPRILSSSQPNSLAFSKPFNSGNRPTLLFQKPLKPMESVNQGSGINNLVPNEYQSLLGSEKPLKMTYSQRQTRINPSSMRPLSRNLRPDPFLPRRKRPIRRSSPPQAITQQRDMRAEIQKRTGIPDGAEVVKKFKSASLNSQNLLQNNQTNSLYKGSSIGNQWSLANEIKSGLC